MQIISHRGLCCDFKVENNKIEAFKHSFDKGIGTETDLRDYQGKIVISHDIPTGEEPFFEDLLKVMNGKNLLLALNIKADGLSNEIAQLLQYYNHTNYFTFDMSIPDMVSQMKQNMKFYTGCSDILETPVLLKKAAGVWLDSFYSEWFDENLVLDFLSAGKKICIVSAELHGRDNKNQWNILKSFSCINTDEITLCTNLPEDAILFFNDSHKLTMC